MNATNLVATEKPVRRGFPSLPCVLCGNADGNVTMSLDDVTQFYCGECEESFDADAVRWSLTQWQAVLTWIDAAPIAAE